VLADKAYDADRIRDLIQEQGATPNIPPKSNRRWKKLKQAKRKPQPPYRHDYS